MGPVFASDPGSSGRPTHGFEFDVCSSDRQGNRANMGWDRPRRREAFASFPFSPVDKNV